VGEDPDLSAVLRGRAPVPAPHPFACQVAELTTLPGSAGEAARRR